MVTRGVSQPPFSFIFAEAPLILCKEDLENLKIFFAKYQRSWCLPLGREPSQEAFGWQRVCSFPPVQAGRTYPWNSNPLVTCRVCRERGQEAVSRAWWLGVFHSLHFWMTTRMLSSCGASRPHLPLKFDTPLSLEESVEKEDKIFFAVVSKWARGVSQPPFPSFIFAEAPLILCKEDLEKILIHPLLIQRQKVPLGKSPGRSKSTG